MATSIRSVESLAELADAAHEHPVVTTLDDLDARLLQQKHGITVIDRFDRFCTLFESPEHTFSNDVVIRDQTASLNLDNTLTTYDPPDVTQIDYTGSIYSDRLNDAIRNDWLTWKDVEQTTLSQSAIGDYVVAVAGTVDVVAVVTIDGLSYRDWTAAGHDAKPVYVDCPTITKCGYPNVVYGGPNGEAIANRLFNEGFSERLGFTYWKKNGNELTEYLHDDFSPNDVHGDIQDFSEIIEYLRRQNWYQDRLYIQITLTGPERVAHKLKEDPIIDAEVEQVHRKLRILQKTLQKEVPSFRIFATADHGILWRMDADDDFTVIDGDWEHYDRRCISNPDSTMDFPEAYGRKDRWDDESYIRLDYPYLFSDLRSNEPGTHGGFSFQESIVPLIELR